MQETEEKEAQLLAAVSDKSAHERLLLVTCDALAKTLQEAEEKERKHDSALHELQSEREEAQGESGHVIRDADTRRAPLALPLHATATELRAATEHGEERGPTVSARKRRRHAAHADETTRGDIVSSLRGKSASRTTARDAHRDAHPD